MREQAGYILGHLCQGRKGDDWVACQGRPGTPEDRVLRELAAESELEGTSGVPEGPRPTAPAAPVGGSPQLSGQAFSLRSPRGGGRRVGGRACARAGARRVARCHGDRRGPRTWDGSLAAPVYPAGAPSLPLRLPGRRGQLGIRIQGAPPAAYLSRQFRRAGSVPGESGSRARPASGPPGRSRAEQLRGNCLRSPPRRGRGPRPGSWETRPHHLPLSWVRTPVPIPPHNHTAPPVLPTRCFAYIYLCLQQPSKVVVSQFSK